MFDISCKDSPRVSLFSKPHKETREELRLESTGLGWAKGGNTLSMGRIFIRMIGIGCSLPAPEELPLTLLNFSLVVLVP